LDNAIEIVNNDSSIKSMVVECSFPSDMQRLAQDSKHLTAKLLSKELKKLKRDDLQLYINHIKPMYLEEIKGEIGKYCARWKPIIVKDGEIIKF
jgi:ribonuclease BN (tRNA processing enzyme)